MMFPEVAVGFAVASVLERLLEERTKNAAELRQIYTVLRAFRSRHARLYISEIEFEIDAVIHFAFPRHAEHFLRAEIILERDALLGGPARRAQIIDGLGFDGVVTHHRAVLRRQHA